MSPASPWSVEELLSSFRCPEVRRYVVISNVLYAGNNRSQPVLALAVRGWVHPPFIEYPGTTSDRRCRLRWSCPYGIFRVHSFCREVVLDGSSSEGRLCCGWCADEDAQWRLFRVQVQCPVLEYTVGEFSEAWYNVSSEVCLVGCG